MTSESTAEFVAMRVADVWHAPADGDAMRPTLVVLDAITGEVRIMRLADWIYFAELLVDGSAGPRTIDARPSDALNLAALLGTPIQVARAVIAQSWRADITWDEARREFEVRGMPPEVTPSPSVFEQIRQLIAGETRGGAAAIVAELQG